MLDAARRERERILASAHAEAEDTLGNARVEAGKLREEAVSIVSEARSMLPELAALDSRLGYLIDRLGEPTQQPIREARQGVAMEPAVTPDEPSEAQTHRGKDVLSRQEYVSFLDQLAEYLENLDRARSTGDRNEVGRVLLDLSDLAAESEADELAALAQHLGPDARPDQLDDLICQCYRLRQSMAGGRNGSAPEA